MNKRNKSFLRNIVIIMAIFILCGISAYAIADNEANSSGRGNTNSTSRAMPLPAIDNSLITDTDNKIVVIQNGATTKQTGYATLTTAMNGIGSGVSTDDYTIVFVQDYSMIVTTDQNAIQSNATDAKSLTLTSSYCTNTNSTKVDRVVTASGSTTAINWPFQADTTLYNMTLNVPSGCSRLLGCCNDLTIGEGFVSSGNLQVFGGSNALITGNTNVVINSGTFENAFGGNYSGNLIGNTNITVQGTARVKNLYVGSQVGAQSDSATGTALINGADGALCDNVYVSYSGTGFPSNGQVNLTLQNATSIDTTNKNNFARIDLLTKNNAQSKVIIDGRSQVCTSITSKSLELKENATLQLGSNIDESKTGTEAGFVGDLNLTGDLILNNNATYIHAGNSATQNVGGDLVVNGSGAKLKIYKASSTSATVPLNIGGAYSSAASDKLSLEIYKDNTIGASDGDVLLKFNNAINADADDYSYEYFNPWTSTYFSTVSDGVNIEYNLVAPISYYEPVGDTVFGQDGLYKYDEVGGITSSDGRLKTVYRILEDYKIYPADAEGNKTGDALTKADLANEHPQPKLGYSVLANEKQASMVRVDEVGKYLLNVAIGTNSTGITGNSIDDGTASGIPASKVNIDNKGTDNASWAILNQTNDNCKVHKAYLVMTTTLANGGTPAQRRNIINKPMTLMAPDGTTMLSNGYLPEGAVDSTTNDAMDTDTPTLIFDKVKNSGTLGEAMTITDVTDFVKKHGYGKYYGIDLPYEGQDIDAAIAWRLIVVEENPTFTLLRKISLQMGPMSNGNSDAPTAVKLSLGGFTTPGTNLGDFYGQILMIGSDNTTGRDVGGGTGSNLHNLFYPDSTKAESIIVGCNDPESSVVDRPINEIDGVGYWSQGFIDVDGVRLTSNQVSHMSVTGAMGIDCSLLNISNKENTQWETEGGHNLYLVKYSPSVKLESTHDRTGIGYIDTLGVSTDIETPEFETKISHSDMTPSEGVDIIAGKTIIVNATATNTTPNASSIAGSFNTTSKIKVDSRLSNIRDISATFTRMDGTKFTPSYTYDAEKHEITFDFGIAEDGYPLYNKAADAISVSFKADTSVTPTINNEDVKYENTIQVLGQDIYRNGEFVRTDSIAVYAHDEDDFNTYKNSITLSKVVKGEDADKNAEFEFVVTVKDSTGNLLTKGTKLPYKGDTVAGITNVDAPADGQATIDENGKFSIKLKHGQAITFDTMPYGTLKTMEVSENSSDYNLSWVDSKDGESYNATNGNTGTINVGENEIRSFDFVNTTKPVGTLTLKKTVIGKNVPNDKAFEFAVGFSGTGTYKYSGDYVGTIKSGDKIQLKDGESITIKIPDGIDYEVAEEDYDNWVTTSEGSTGTITTEPSVATFTNRYVDPNGAAGEPGNLEITKKADSTTVKRGEKITYKINLKNTGEEALVGIRVRDYMPQYTQFVSVNDKIGEYGAIDGKEHVTWFIERIDGGESIELSFTARVNECVPNDFAIKNSALYSVTGEDEKPNCNIKDDPGNGTPIASVKADNPKYNSLIKTGDTTNIVPFIVILVITIVVLIGIVVYTKKKK